MDEAEVQIRKGQESGEPWRGFWRGFCRTIWSYTLRAELKGSGTVDAAESFSAAGVGVSRQLHSMMAL